jgi:hypothetical protein
MIILPFIPVLLWFAFWSMFLIRRYNRNHHRPDYAKIAALETEIFGKTDIKLKNEEVDSLMYGFGYGGPPPSFLARANFPKRIQPEETVTYPEARFGDPNDTSGITSEDW